MATAVLVSLADMQSFLSVGATDGALIQSLLDGVEEQFLADCNRRDRPFITNAIASRVEIHAGTGTSLLALDYPVASIASITLGRNPSAPEVTLDPSDTTQVSFLVGKRNVMRVDGGVWGVLDAPAYVHVTYTTQVDTSSLAAVAVKRAVAAIYRQMGAEDTTRERLSSYERDLRQVYADDAIWKYAVHAHWEPRI